MDENSFVNSREEEDKEEAWLVQIIFAKLSTLITKGQNCYICRKNNRAVECNVRGAFHLNPLITDERIVIWI